MNKLTHLDSDGQARMVDISAKPDTERAARATGSLLCAPETLACVRSGTAPKGAVIATAELAGVMGAKRTSDLIPLCHPLLLTHVAVSITIDDDLPGFRIVGEARTRGATGLEMEALTAVTIAGLTLFDMLKAIDRTMRLSDVRVVVKSGGRSGAWSEPDA